MSKPKTTVRVLTNKRGRDRLRELQNNIQKGTTKMRNKIKNTHKKLNKNSLYRSICLLVRTFTRVLQMTVPALVGGYLVYKYDDKIVIGIGVALALYSFVRVINSAYKAEQK